MKKYMLKLALLSGVTMVLFSCQKSTLNPTSTTALDDKTAFATLDRIDGQVKGIYAAIKSGQVLGGRYFLYNDARAENLVSEDPNRVTVRAPWEFSVGSSDDEPRNLWSNAYSTINRANLFLDGMEAGGNAVAGAKATEFQGEARFLRGLSYYILVTTFARPYWDGNGSKRGLPLRLKGIKGPGFNELAPVTVAEVYTQILQDLDFAETNLAATVADATARTTRAHKNTAIALKTRVYLSMRDYPKVITEANKIVSTTAPFKAPSGVANALAANITNLFTGTSTDLENIFSMPFTVNDAPGTQNQLGHYYRPSSAGGQGIFSLNANGVIGDTKWTKADDRRKLIDTASSKSYLKKFNSGSPWLDFAPVIRYSEVMLNLAEALARGNAGVDARAVELLNAVRNRSDKTTTYTTASFANQAELLVAILQERNIEFLGEGIRSLDIWRLGLDFPTKSSGGFIVTAIPSTSPAYIFPISSDETRLNPLISN
ncbi:RagB/SusD family nutrient uptake outer membrane protein [Paraflavitalea pollutisoli]|uniref:RagB/SusD family nutrient uptake outer membrane protein n=1 Tax=Paraflavitalea pollutisoli TaxID=3034143 RepID=UPI0023ECF19C|nr:RagB/SusD family nutrient uptake outer membrane protein [Paraflavitalea sp. H1-2-19X]